MGEQARFQWLKEALSFCDNSKQWRCPRWPILLLSVVMLMLVSIVFLAIGDALNAKGAVLTRFLARAQAPLTAQWSYLPQARDQITVLLYDEEFLTGTGSAWPISYGEHASNLKRLVADTNALPKAIFLDITFGQVRDDKTISQLAQALCEIQNPKKKEHAVPVFLAALPSNGLTPLAVRKELMNDKGMAACATLVGVDYFPDPLDGLAWTYELSRHRTVEGWRTGPGGPEDPTYRSAALAMAQLDKQLGPEVGPMALVWGLNSAKEQRAATLKNCMRGEPSWSRLIPGVLRKLWEPEDKLPLCPYHATLSMDQLNVMNPVEINAHLKDKFVMVGANVPGYNDFVHSPVHGLLPGIHVHAMALDNFLTFGDGYLVSAEWDKPSRKELFLPSLVVVAVVFLVHLLWNLVRRRVWAFWRHLHAFQDFQRWRRRYRASPEWAKWATPRLLKGLGWIVRLTLQTIAAMILIALLQKVFRIGMVPVAELVGMTLVAEGLNVARRLKNFLFESTAPPRRATPSM